MVVGSNLMGVGCGWWWDGSVGFVFFFFSVGVFLGYFNVLCEKIGNKIYGVMLNHKCYVKMYKITF